MKLEQIKAAVAAGLPVYWKNCAYRVMQDSGSASGFSIVYNPGGRGENRTGLTWQDGVKLNGLEEDFHVAESSLDLCVDDALSERPASEAVMQKNIRYVGFDGAGHPPRVRRYWVAVWSYLHTELDEGEATEIAIDLMQEYNLLPFSDNPHASIVI